MAILVTGAAGRFGAETVRALLEMGEDVLALDAPGPDGSWSGPEGAIVVPFAGGEAALLADILRDHACSGVIHTAMPDGPGSPAAVARAVADSVSVFAAAAEAGAAQGVIASSAEVAAAARAAADAATPGQPGTAAGRLWLSEQALAAVAGPHMAVAVLRLGPDLTAADVASAHVMALRHLRATGAGGIFSCGAPEGRALPGWTPGAGPAPGHSTAAPGAEAPQRRAAAEPADWMRLIDAGRGKDPAHAAFLRHARLARLRVAASPEVQLKIMSGAIERGLLDFARDTLSGMYPLLRGRPDIRLQAARLALASGDDMACREITGHLIHPANPQAYGLRLMALSNLGRFREAFDLINDGIPNLHQIEWALTKLFSDYGQTRRDMDEFVEAVETVAEAHGEQYLAAKVRLLVRARQFELALDLCKPLIAMCPTSPPAAAAVAEAHLRSSNWPKASEVLPEVIGYLPPDSDLAREAVLLIDLLERLNALYRDRSLPIRIPRDHANPASVLEYCYLGMGADDEAEASAPPAVELALVGASTAAADRGAGLVALHGALRDGEEVAAELWLLSGGDGPHGRVLPRAETSAAPFCWLPPPIARDAARIRQAIAGTRPRVLHAWEDATNLRAAIAGIAAGVERIVLHSGNLRPDLAGPELPQPAQKRAYRALLARPGTDFVCNSRATLDSYLSWLKLEATGRQHVVHDGFDWTHAPALAQLDRTRAELRAAHGVPQEAPLVGGILDLAAPDRAALWVEAALTAAARMPDLHVLLAGDGPLGDELRQKVRAAGLGKRVRMIAAPGAVTDLAPAFDVLMHSAEFEGLPSTVIAALGCGVPAVATAYGGTFECVPPGSRMEALGLVAGNQPGDFADALAAMLRDRPGADAMRDVAGDVRAYFSLGRMAREVRAIHTR